MLVQSGYAFEELDATLEFQNSINYSSDDFYNRLNHLVLKYDAPKNEIPKILQKKYSVINNGVVFVIILIRKIVIQLNF